jgi:hypothetical protein
VKWHAVGVILQLESRTTMQHDFFTAAALTTLLSIFSLNFGASTATAAEAPESGVTITDVTYRGTGCPPGSTAVNIAPDYQALTVLFADFIVEKAPEARQRRVRSACDVDVHLSVPSGWSMALFAVQFRGYLALDAGATGHHGATLHIPGTQPFRMGEMVVTGPSSRDYISETQHRLDGVRWTPCNSSGRRSLKIMSDISIDGAADAGGLLTVDSLDGEVRENYKIAWKRCR